MKGIELYELNKDTEDGVCDWTLEFPDLTQNRWNRWTGEISLGSWS